MRFFDDLIWHCQEYAGMPGWNDQTARAPLEVLFLDQTKRALFDFRRAALFADLGERPPRRCKHWPGPSSIASTSNSMSP